MYEKERDKNVIVTWIAELTPDNDATKIRKVIDTIAAMSLLVKLPILEEKGMQLTKDS